MNRYSEKFVQWLSIGLTNIDGLLIDTRQKAASEEAHSADEPTHLAQLPFHQWLFSKLCLALFEDNTNLRGLVDNALVCLAQVGCSVQAPSCVHVCLCE